MKLAKVLLCSAPKLCSEPFCRSKRLIISSESNTSAKSDLSNVRSAFANTDARFLILAHYFLLDFITLISVSYGVDDEIDLFSVCICFILLGVDYRTPHRTVLDSQPAHVSRSKISDYVISSRVLALKSVTSSPKRTNTQCVP